MKIPSSNIQAPEKLQAPNPKGGGAIANVGAWDLKILWSLEHGIWSLFQE